MASAWRAPTGWRETCMRATSICLIARGPPIIIKGSDRLCWRSFMVPFAASSCSRKPANHALAMEQSVHSFLLSTKTHSVAPRLKASMPTEPVPENRSRARTVRSSKRPMLLSMLNIDSRTMAFIGLISGRSGCSSRRPLAMPLFTTHRDGKSQLLCDRGGPCFSLHSNFFFDLPERAKACCLFLIFALPLRFALTSCRAILK
mmetsp:Transcript_96985/g.296428  ORF Transcript_96985/g.296428 Transcript_96985/m.296428 type:complete len:203 (-) Transcript_96985:107-715(-)